MFNSISSSQEEEHIASVDESATQGTESLASRAVSIALDVAQLAPRVFAVALALCVLWTGLSAIYTGKRPLNFDHLTAIVWLVCVIWSAWPRKAKGAR